MQSIARHMPDAGMQSARMQSISRRTVGAGMQSIARHRPDAGMLIPADTGREHSQAHGGCWYADHSQAQARCWYADTGRYR